MPIVIPRVSKTGINSWDRALAFIEYFEVFLPTLSNGFVNWVIVFGLAIFLYARYYHTQGGDDWSWYSMVSKGLLNIACVILVVGCCTNTIELREIFDWQQSERNWSKHPYHRESVKRNHYFNMIGYFVGTYFFHGHMLCYTLHVFHSNKDLIKRYQTWQSRLYVFAAVLMTAGGFMGLVLAHAFWCLPIPSFWIANKGEPTCSPFSIQRLLYLRLFFNLTTHMLVFHVPTMYQKEGMFDKKQLLTTIMKIIMLVFVAICAGLQTTFLQYVFNGKHRKTYQQAANGITNIMFWGEVEVWVAAITHGMLVVKPAVAEWKKTHFRKRLSRRAPFRVLRVPKGSNPWTPYLLRRTVFPPSTLPPVTLPPGQRARAPTRVHNPGEKIRPGTQW